MNAALLGTDRRPVPTTGDDPAGWLLDAAARRRTRALVAGATTVVRLGEPAPRDPRPTPSEAATEALDELLRQGSAALLDLWLREALAAGVAPAAQHWAPLLDRARRSTELDRPRLGAVLGPRGLWFARHNPAWSAVVRAAGQPLLTVDEEEAAGLRDLEALVAGTVPLRAARAYGQHVGARVPLAAYAAVTAAPVGATWPAERTEAAVRSGLAGAEEVLWVRWGLAHAFDPGRQPPERRPVPPVPPVRQEHR